MSKYTAVLQRGYVVYSFGVGPEVKERVYFKDWNTGRFKDTMVRTVKILEKIDAVSTDASQIQVLLRILSTFDDDMETGDTSKEVIARIDIDVDLHFEEGPILISNLTIFHYSDDDDDEDCEEVPMCLGSIKGTVHAIRSTFLQ